MLASCWLVLCLRDDMSSWFSCWTLFQHMKNDREKNVYDGWPELIELEGCIPKYMGWRAAFSHFTASYRNMKREERDMFVWLCWVLHGLIRSFVDRGTKDWKVMSCCEEHHLFYLFSCYLDGSPIFQNFQLKGNKSWQMLQSKIFLDFHRSN